MEGALRDDTKTCSRLLRHLNNIIVGRNTCDDVKSVAVTSYANVCLDGCKTDGNHKKDNRMITKFGQ